MAKAADVLSDQFRAHLGRFSRLIKPHADQLDRRFLARMRTRGHSAPQLKALCDISPGSAARFFAAHKPPAEFFELVEYSGRRLAKLNVAPSQVLGALREYDRVLEPVLRSNTADDRDFRWVREQLQFCVVLTLNDAYYQVREAEAQAFYHLFHAELQAESLDDLLRGFLETLRRFCHARDGRLLIFETSATRPAAPILKRLARPRLIARSHGHKELILDPRLRARYPWFWSVPLWSDTTAEGRLAGVLQLAFSKEYHWLPRELELLDIAAERLLRAAEKARLAEDLARREAQVRELSEHMMQIEEEERRRISRELHDEVGQSLLCIRLKLEMLGRVAPGHLAPALTEAQKLTEHTISEIRRIISALRPAVLDQLGLAAALRQTAVRLRTIFPVRVRLHLPPTINAVPRQAGITVFRLVQECLHNIAKHSRATTVSISLHSTDKTLRLIVEDDGVGFEVKAALEKANSFGLVGMRERVALLGGKSEITSQPGQGTRVSVEIPIWRAQIGKELPANAGKAQRGYGQDSHLSHRRSHALSPRN